MRVNIENTVRHSGANSHSKYLLECLIGDLKKLKELTENNNDKLLKEFFDFYVFDEHTL